ncbi:cytochrome P450 94C1-like [Cicer arietinum]|uniref:Cytochrome P450 94C1-like n=1 Tax=Cicer arietinum TaxID=3827 RepID=A0A1S2Z712_CICAR|nr:cytochrome P450 94C1-like [Cicer arietinum]XP_012567514.1 cytochrome P450 94C1-like [Cicer arietinum]
MDQLHEPLVNRSMIFPLTTFTLIILILVFIIFFPSLSSCFQRMMSSSIFCSCEICQAYLTSSWSKDFNNLSDWYTHLLKKSPTKTIHIHVLRNTITSNSENVEYMLKTKFENYPKGKPFSMILGDFLGRGIFNVDGELWKFQKKMASLEINKHSIRSFAFEVVNNEIQNRLIPLLQNQNDVVLDLQDVFKRLSFDAICRFSFGLDPMCLEKSLPMSDFALSFDLASKLSAERAMTVSPLIWKIKRFFNLGSEKELKKSITMINTLAKVVINQRRKMGFCDQKDLLSRFMSTVQDDIFLRDIVISFLLAGRDTVASSLTSFFWLLAKNPEVESQILLEAERVIGIGKHNKNNNNINVVTNFEQLTKLHYLEAATHESMRLYPPIQFDSKFCLEDDVLPDGTKVKSGTRVTYHPYAMGRLEELWGPDCLEFKPQRWLKDGVFHPQNQFKYPIFQGGLRVCIGKEMALMELKTVVLSLLTNFHFELADQNTFHGFNHLPRFSPGLTATFAFGLPVFVRQRGNQ